MRVLLVGINFSPEPTGIGPYMRAYADALHGVGHDVTVITGLPHYPQWRIVDRGSDEYPYAVIRCVHFVPRTSSPLGRLKYETTFALAVNRRLPELGRFEVTLAVIPTLGSAAVAASWARRYRTPMLIVVQDIVSSAAGLTGPLGTAFGLLGGRVEHWIFRQATGIATISAGMRAALIRRGGRAEQIVLTPNWPLHASPQLDPSVARARAGYPLRRLICLHAGNMGAKQGLEVVVKAARLAQDRQLALQFVLIGDGNQRVALEEMSRGTSGLEFRSLQSAPDYEAALAGADVLLVTQKASVRDMALPSKLTSYLGAGKPIVASVSADSVTAAELARSGAAIVVPPNDAEALLGAIIELESNPELGTRLAQRAQRYYETELDPGVLRAQFVQFVEQAKSAKPRLSPA